MCEDKQAVVSAKISLLRGLVWIKSRDVIVLMSRQVASTAWSDAASRLEASAFFLYFYLEDNGHLRAAQ